MQTGCLAGPSCVELACARHGLASQLTGVWMEILASLYGEGRQGDDLFGDIGSTTCAYFCTTFSTSLLAVRVFVLLREHARLPALVPPPKQEHACPLLSTVELAPLLRGGLV